MNYDDKDRYDEDDDFGYNNDFGRLIRRRRNESQQYSTESGDPDEYKPRTRKKSDIVYGGGTIRYRNDDLQSHYIPRVSSGRRGRQGTRNDSEGLRRQQIKQSDQTRSILRKSPNSNKSEVRSGKFESQMSRSSVVVCAVCLFVVTAILASMVIRSLYTSNSLFSDGGGNDIAIQERLITSEENKDKVTYFLIVGVDKSSMLTDCIWLMCFDNQAHQMNVMQIPRDTYVRNASQNHKINGVYSNPQTVDWCDTCNRALQDSEIQNSVHIECGTNVSQKTESNINALIRYINDHLGMPVDHYVLFDFEGFEKVVDAMGGVDITLEEDLKVYPNKKEYEILPAGENHLDGEMALKFMRNRQAYTDGDLGRVKAQRKIIHAMMEKVMDMSAINVFSVLTAAYGNFSTDMSLEEIRSFISPVKKCDSDALNMFEMPGYSHWAEPHETHQSYYVCSEAETLEVINEYLLPYGDKLTAEDINFPVPVD